MRLHLRAVNAAHVGKARAALSLKDFAKVVSDASAVPSGFSSWIEFSGAQDREQRPLRSGPRRQPHRPRVALVSPGALRDPEPDRPQTDPPIQHAKSWVKGHNALTPLYKPYQGLRFSDHGGQTQAPASASCPNCTGAVAASSGDTGPLLLWQKDTDVLLGGYLEAQHHPNSRQGWSTPPPGWSRPTSMSA